jgi:hypothetical protein
MARYRANFTLGAALPVPWPVHSNEWSAKKWLRCFYISLTVHPVMILGKWPTGRTVLFYVLISILYMLRATLCSSSGESIVSIQHLVCVTLCRWPSGMQVRKESSFPTCTRNGHLHRVTHTRCCIDTVDSPDDEHEIARNMKRIEMNT